MLPHVALGSLTPKPMKDREDSVSMQVAKSRVALTIITVMMLGRMWRKMMPNSLTPKALAAVTNSCSRSASTLPRTRRAMPGQERKPKMNIIKMIRCSSEILLPKILDKIIQKGRKGMEETISVKRISRLSSLPPL